MLETRLLADRVLFIDAEAMVIDKHAGLPVDAPRDGGISVESHLDMLRFGFKRPPMPVHRLDRDTSGCLLIARNPRAHKKFGAAFEAGTVEKVYLAVVEGQLDGDEGTVDMPLAKVSTRESGWRMVGDARGKAASTHWQVVERIGARALVRLTPATGRTHQLRVHMASGVGTPIVGDPVYGKAGEPMLLHASSLRLARDPHPPIEAASPLPASFAAAGFAHG